MKMIQCSSNESEGVYESRERPDPHGKWPDANIFPRTGKWWQKAAVCSLQFAVCSLSFVISGVWLVLCGLHSQFAGCKLQGGHIVI
jgi:hypothetical protein